MKKFLSLILVLVFPVSLFAGNVMLVTFPGDDEIGTAVPMECVDDKMIAVTNQHIVRKKINGNITVAYKKDALKAPFKVAYVSDRIDIAFIEIDLSGAYKGFCKENLFSFQKDDHIKKSVVGVIFKVEKGMIKQNYRSGKVYYFGEIENPDGSSDGSNSILSTNFTEPGDSGSVLVDGKNKNKVVGITTGIVEIKKGEEYTHSIYVNEVLKEYEKYKKKKSKSSMMSKAFLENKSSVWCRQVI